MSDDVTIPRRRALATMIGFAFRADPVRSSLAFVAATLTAVTAACSPVLMAGLVNAVLSGNRSDALRWAVGIGASTAAAYSFGILRLDLRFRIEESVAMLVDQRLIELCCAIPGVEHHERPELLDELDLLREQRGHLSGSVGALIENLNVLVQVVATGFVLLAVHPLLLLLPLAGVPSVVASARVRSAWKTHEEEIAESARLAQHLTELATTAASGKELRVFGLRDELERRHEAVRLDMEHRTDRVALRTALQSGLAWTVFGLGYVGAIGFVAWRAATGRSSAGDVVLVVTASAHVNQQVTGFYWMVGWLFDTLKTVGRYLGLVIRAEQALIVHADAAPAPERLESGITLAGVEFTYPGTERPILAGVDLVIPAGSTIAVVGENGVGKSTMMKLLCRFYEPTAGSISVDGVDLRRIDHAEWRARVSAGFQDFARYELAAAETVGVGDLGHLDDRAWIDAALDRAAAADVAPTLPDGLDSLVGKRFEGGTELSGGQWQKLALARAMMRDRPLLLVLDEPTAALDADTEHALFERYASAARVVAAESGAITVLVSHRFSTVRMADLIVVVEGGAVTEIGSHAELMSRAGTYAELFELQARAYR